MAGPLWHFLNIQVTFVVAQTTLEAGIHMTLRFDPLENKILSAAAAMNADFDPRGYHHESSLSLLAAHGAPQTRRFAAACLFLLVYPYAVILNSSSSMGRRGEPALACLIFQMERLHRKIIKGAISQTQ